MLCKGFGPQLTYITPGSSIDLDFFSLLLFVREIVIFYTEISTGKVVLWCFFTSETSAKIHNSTFRVKISVQNVIFSNEMEKLPRYDTCFSIEFGKNIKLHEMKNKKKLHGFSYYKNMANIEAFL